MGGTISSVLGSSMALGWRMGGALLPPGGVSGASFFFFF